MASHSKRDTGTEAKRIALSRCDKRWRGKSTLEQLALKHPEYIAPVLRNGACVLDETDGSALAAKAVEDMCTLDGLAAVVGAPVIREGVILDGLEHPLLRTWIRLRELAMRSVSQLRDMRPSQEERDRERWRHESVTVVIPCAPGALDGLFGERSDETGVGVELREVADTDA
jgi:hypothetical protein